MRRWRTALPQGQSLQRVRTTTVLQYEAVECGAASLKIVLAYFGLILPLADLRERLGISRDGVTALQLMTAAEDLGLRVRALQVSARRLRSKGRFPCILFWNFNHFLVLEGFEADQAWLSDPACGRRRVSWEEFTQSFTGVVLHLEPGEGFQPAGREPPIHRWLPLLLVPYRPMLPWLLLLSLLAALPELFIAGASSQFIDAFLEEGRENIAIPVIWVSAIAAAGLVSLLHLQKQLLRLLANRLLKRVGSLTFITLFSLPYRAILQRLRGELANRLLLADALVEQGIAGVLDFLLTLVSALIALLIGVFISPWLAALTVLIAALNGGLTGWWRARREGDNLRLAMMQAKSQGVGTYVIQSIESVKASGLESQAFMQWSAGFNQALGELQKQSLANGLIGLIGQASGFLLRCSVILLGGVLIIVGQLTLGELMAFQFLVGMIQAPLQQLSQLSAQLQQMDGALGRLNDLLDSRADPYVRSFATLPANVATKQLRGDLEVRDLRFQFSALTPPLFAGLSLRLRAGEHLAIVGGSGSGKSTLLRLIAGLHPVSEGAVLYDGRPWLKWDDDTMRHSIALVAQDVFLFPATLHENVTLWDPRFGRHDVIQALDQVGLLKDLGGVAALDLTVGESGGNLSGGQRQRVEIARALVRKPSLLLLDEATSALDQRRERAIMAAIKATPATLITVAHRLHGAKFSDLVLVLEQGQPVQLGAPDVLAAQPGPFQQMLKAEDGGGPRTVDR